MAPDCPVETLEKGGYKHIILGESGGEYAPFATFGDQEPAIVYAPWDNYRPPGEEIVRKVREKQEEFSYDLDSALDGHFGHYFEAVPGEEREAYRASGKPKGICSDVELRVREVLEDEGYWCFGVQVFRRVSYGGREQNMPHAATLAVGGDCSWFLANSISPFLEQPVFSYRDAQAFVHTPQSYREIKDWLAT